MASRLVQLLLKARWLLPIVIYAVFRTKRLTKGRGKAKVLCLSRAIFKNDVDALVDLDSGIEYLYFPSQILQEIYLANLAHFNISPDNVDEVTYHDEELFELRERIFLITRSFFSLFLRLQPIDLVLTGQYSYQRFQALPLVCREFSIPFYTLFKEGIIGKNQYPRIIEEINKRPYLGDFISFYNGTIRDGLIEGNSGVTLENSDVVGVPRLDKVFKKRTRMCLLSFQPSAKFFDLSAFFGDDSYIDKDKMKKIETITYDFYRVIIEYYLEHPNEELVIKTKNAIKEIVYVDSVVKDILRGRVASNIKVTNSGRAEDYLDQSGIVCGFNTTGLLEGVLRDKLVLTPDFKPVLGDHEHEITVDLDSCNLQRVTDENSFRDIMRSRKMDDQLSGLLGENLGRSSSAVENRIMDLVGKH